MSCGYARGSIEIRETVTFQWKGTIDFVYMVEYMDWVKSKSGGPPSYLDSPQGSQASCRDLVRTYERQADAKIFQTPIFVLHHAPTTSKHPSHAILTSTCLPAHTATMSDETEREMYPSSPPFPPSPLH